MKTLAVRGIRLSRASFDAWKSADVLFARQDRGSEWVQRWLDRDPDGRQAINLGSSALELRSGSHVWNGHETVQTFTSPRRTRRLLGHLMPDWPLVFPAHVWLKEPRQRAGNGTWKVYLAQHLYNVPRDGDAQVHVDGQEVRLVTVGHRVVQQHLRHGPNGDRTYQWVPMRQVSSRAKATVREAARLLPGRNIIAWDVIVTEQGLPYILEGNTCPGMGTATAGRIQQEMARVNQEGTIPFE